MRTDPHPVPTVGEDQVQGEREVRLDVTPGPDYEDDDVEGRDVSIGVRIGMFILHRDGIVGRQVW